MTPNEAHDCLSNAKKLFDTMKVNEYVCDAWYENLLKKYSVGEFKRAFKHHVLEIDKAPTIASMKKCFETLFGKRYQETPAVDRAAKRPENKIEFCLRVLGAPYVNQEIKKIVGDPNTPGAWAKLVSQKQWIPDFKKCVGRLEKEAKWKLGKAIQGELYGK